MRKFALAAALAGLVPAGPGLAQESSIAQGETLYAKYCASCHGSSLEGQEDWQSPGEDGVLRAPPHDHTGHTWHHDDSTLFNYTKLGGQAALEQMGVTGVISGMPGFSDSLTDQDILDVLAFIKSAWPEDVQEMQKQRTLAAQSQEN